MFFDFDYDTVLTIVVILGTILLITVPYSIRSSLRKLDEKK